MDGSTTGGAGGTAGTAGSAPDRATNSLSGLMAAQFLCAFVDKAWNLVIARRAAAMKNLLYLGGVGSYAWGANGSHAASSDRVTLARTYSSIDLP